jgi:hypothetical protein
MRRRRHRLEVSTFPFLAVLLCAMGSLILMLLVLDRRAKAAARERAYRAVEQVAAEELRLAEAREQEWEQRRQALHAQLLAQEGELNSQIAAIQRQIAAAQTNLAAEEERQKSGRERLLDEQKRLAHLEEDIRDRKAEAANAETKAQDSNQEFRRLTAELRSLERTLAELKALRAKQQNTYSVVPYRGRRGDSRAPLYLECAPSGLIFHPDKKTIASPRTAASEIKTEVERRVAQQRAKLNLAAGAPNLTPYLLLLVRPDGITTYYLTLKCLQGLDLDFGYELIDADWVLEFPKDGESAKPQPWMVTEKPASANPAQPPITPRPAPMGLSMRAGGGGSGSGGRPAETGTAGSGAGSGTGPLRAAGKAQLSEPGASVPGPQVSKPGASATGPRPSEPGASATGPLPSAASIGPPIVRDGSLSTGRPVGVAFGSAPGQPGSSGPSDAPSVFSRGSGPLTDGAGQPSAPPVLALPGSNPVGGTRGPGIAGSPSQGAVGGSPGGPGQVAATPGQPGGQSGRLLPGTTGSGPGTAMASSPYAAVKTDSGGPSPATASVGTLTPGASSPAGGSDAPGVPHTPTPVPTSTAQGPRGPEGQAASGNGMSQAKGTSAGGANAGAGQGVSVPGGSRLAPLAAISNELAKPKRPARPPEVRPVILGGDRDYIILLECRANAVVLHPFGNSFSAESLAPDNGGAVLLQEAIRRLIARRQATVRPGEQPYRPQVRFLVRPDGLRSLYRAYPVLEGLHVPLTRQNLEADEEINLNDY